MNCAALVGEGVRGGTTPSWFHAPEGAELSAAQPGRRLLDADSWATPDLQGSTPGLGALESTFDGTHMGCC